MKLSPAQDKIVKMMGEGFKLFANSFDGDVDYNESWLAKECCKGKFIPIKKNTFKSLLRKGIIDTTKRVMMFYEFHLTYK